MWISVSTVHVRITEPATIQLGTMFVCAWRTTLERTAAMVIMIKNQTYCYLLLQMNVIELVVHFHEIVTDKFPSSCMHLNLLICLIL